MSANIKRTFGKKKKIALTIAFIFVTSSLMVVFFNKSIDGEDHTRATMEDLLNSRSERSGKDPDAIVVDKDLNFMILAATPVAIYYDNEERVSAPLLCTGDNPDTPDEGESKSTQNFLDAYDRSNILTIDSHDVESQSILLAKTYWKFSDGAMLVKMNDQGYGLAVCAVALASYLDIPVIITKDQGSEVDRALSILEVRYTLICGDLEGYGKVWNLGSKEEINSIIATGYSEPGGEVRSILKDRLGMDTNYVVMANPNDVLVPNVLDSFTKEFDGIVKHSDTGSTSFPSSSEDAPTFYMDIPEDYQYARVTIDSTMDCVDPRNFGTAISHGERSYVYFGIDEDNDGKMVHDEDSDLDTLHFMSPSLAYSYDGGGSNIQAVCHTDYPIFNSTGEKCIQIKASLDYKITQDSHLPGPGITEDLFSSETSFTISATVEKLDSYIYPRLAGASALAPYLAAFRGGVVLADRKYSVHDEEMALSSNSGDPTANKELYKEINSRTMNAKEDLNELLSELAGMDGVDSSTLANTYASRDITDPMFLCILADPFMVPQFYYENTQSEYGESEGFGTASDNGYSNIDMDLDDPPFNLDGSDPTLELAVGRITGWDIQDTASQIARTFFYDDIIDSFPGHSGSFKDSALSSHGTVIPVGAAETVVKKLEAAYEQAGFTVDAYHNFALSDSKYSAQYYETSNFIFECAHGHYYWFVPPGYKDTSAGGGFTVANVQDMDFGPGVIFASSCVTGKVDGIPLYNGLSQAFIHSGMNAYIGASRLSWGSLVPSPMASPSGEALGGYLGLLFYGYLTGFIYDRDGGLRSESIGDLPLGAALMHAKNDFTMEQGTDGGGPNDDTTEEFNLHGDPAFNPYEPIFDS